MEYFKYAIGENHFVIKEGLLWDSLVRFQYYTDPVEILSGDIVWTTEGEIISRFIANGFLKMPCIEYGHVQALQINAMAMLDLDKNTLWSHFVRGCKLAAEKLYKQGVF